MSNVNQITTKDQTTTKVQFIAMTRPLIGMPVSRTWRGHGSAIFLELGELTERTLKTHPKPDGSFRTMQKGEATIMIEWSWRVELPKSVAFGSWSSNRKITNGIAKLKGVQLLEITTEGRLPELEVQLSGGFWLHSFTTVESQPQWVLFFNSEAKAEKWILSKNGSLVLSTNEP